MSQAAVTRWGTSQSGISSSDTAELVIQHNIVAGTFVLSSPTLGVSTGNATFSATKFYIAATNFVVVQATATGASFTGINIATGAYVLVAAYRTIAGTNAIIAGATGATIGACAMPVVPSTANAYGLILLGGGATAFTGGATELDATNAGAVFWNLTGPAGIAVSTAPITKTVG